MSGRAHASMHKAAGFVVCTLLCTALLASPGAWAQRASDAGFAAKDQAEQADRASSDAAEHTTSTTDTIAQTNSPERADEQRTSDDQSNAPSSNDQNKVPTQDDQNGTTTQDDQKDTATQDNQSDTPSSNDQRSDIEADSSEKADETSLTAVPKVGDEFQAPITIGNKPVDCWFRITSINPNEVAVGTHKGEQKRGAYTYYDNAVPRSTAGDIATLPTSVKDKRTNIEYRVTCVGDCAFHCCGLITSTGLAGQTSITKLEHCAYDSGGIKDTGLGSNVTVKRIECAAFQRSVSLVNTGLDTNHTVSTIEKLVFYRDPNLGSTGDSSYHVNKGDLVLNQPRDGSKLSIGFCAFAGTGFQKLYLLCNKDKLVVDPQAFGEFTEESKAITPFTTMYTNASWASTPNWSGAGKAFDINKGTLVIMSPLQSISATRTPGTSDAASATLTINQPFKVSITNAQGKKLVQNYQLNTSTTTPTKVNVPIAGGLSPAAEDLIASVEESHSFVYPANAQTRTYNTVKASPASCELSAISFTIDFNGNGAQGAMPSMPSVLYGSATPLVPQAFSRENMQFDHWSTLQDDKDADGQINLTRKDGAPIGELPAVEGATITLFAQWDIGLSILSFDKAKGAETGALAGVGYTLKTTNDKEAEGMQGLFTLDAQGQKHPIQKDDWPLLSDTSGKVGMYYLPKGTYYLFNERASAGYTCLESSQRLVIDKKDGQIITTLDGVPLEEQNTSPARISIAFEKVPSLPTTGTLPAGLLQAVGTLIAASTCIALIRRSRNRKQGGIK